MSLVSYVGELRWVAFSDVPDGYLPCEGQLLQIPKYTALYSVIGTAYGGDGMRTFGIPNIQDRVIIGAEHIGDLGTTGGDHPLTSTSDSPTMPYLALRCLIAFEGYYPPRP